MASVVLKLRRMNKLWSLAGCLMFVACSRSTYDFGTNGVRILCVPKHDINLVSLPEADVSTRLQVGQGHTPGVPFLFNAADVRRRVSGYAINSGFPEANFLNDLYGEVSFLDPHDQARYGPGMRGAFVGEIWLRRKPCENPQIGQPGNMGVYQARCSDRDRNSLLLSRYPDSRVAMPNSNTFVLASCRDESVDFGPYKDAIAQNCIRSVIINGFLVDYHFQQQNAGLIAQFDNYLRDKIAEWKRNCR